MPHCSPSSRKRLELELFGDPITKMTSTKPGQFFDSILPVLRRVTNIFLVRPLDVRKPLMQCTDDIPTFIHAQRRLRDIRKVDGILHFQLFDIFDRGH